MEYIDKYSKKVFGQIVGIVQYDRVNHDRFGYLICDIRDIHRLETPEPKILDIQYGKRFDGAVIGGYWIVLYGYETCKKMMINFINDCETRLKKAGATGISVEIKEM
jgi:hypothetical protein